MKFLNQKRLRDYPRLILFANGLILTTNLIFHQGWMGGLGQILGIDYLLFYSTGLIYRQDPSNIYRFEVQNIVQKYLISPTQLPAVNPYFNPPYVALAHSLLTYLSLPQSLLAWSLLSVAFMFIDAKLLYPYIPDQLNKHNFTLTQFLIVIFSFFPFIEGFLAGQNHTLTLLLVSCITLFSISERWYLSGIAAGLLLYKPQFILGFLIVWLFGRKIKPLLAFAMVAIIWVGTFLLINGISLFRDYFLVSSILLKLPFDNGFPAYLLTTPYGLVTSILPDSFWMVAYRLSQIFLIIYSAVIAWQADKNRKNRGERLICLYCLAILFPLIATPYALLHDLLILIPLFVMFSRLHTSRSLLLLVVGTYLGGLLLPLAGYFTKLSITPLITIVITIYLIKVLLHKSYRTTFNNESYLGGEI